MSSGSDSEKLQQQRQSNATIQIQTQSIQEHLTSLQTWDLAEGQQLDQRRQEYTQTIIGQEFLEANQSLTSHAQQQLPAAQALTTAPGQPVQVQTPAKKTFKERQQDKKLLAQAKKANHLADLSSYHAVQSLKDLSEALENSLNIPDLAETVQKNGVDARVLRSFCNGHRTDRTGKPLNPGEEQRRQQDEAFLLDYVSVDLQRRQPHLDRIVTDLLRVKISDDMLSEAYILSHTAQLKQLLDRMVYFQNIKDDPVNAPYFDQMDPLTTQLLETRVFSRYGQLSMYFTAVLRAKGVNTNMAAFSDEDDEDEFYFEERDTQGTLLRDVLSQTQTAEDEAVETIFNKLVEQEISTLDQTSGEEKAQAHKEKNDPAPSGFSPDEVVRYRDIIQSHPQSYAANQQTIDKLYQDLYRTADTLGDLTRKSQAYQRIMAAHKEGGSVSQQLLADTAQKRLEAATTQIELMAQHFRSLTQSMDRLLG